MRQKIVILLLVFCLFSVNAYAAKFDVKQIQELSNTALVSVYVWKNLYVEGSEYPVNWSIFHEPPDKKVQPVVIEGKNIVDSLKKNLTAPDYLPFTLMDEKTVISSVPYQTLIGFNATPSADSAQTEKPGGLVGFLSALSAKRSIPETFWISEGYGVCPVEASNSIIYHNGKRVLPPDEQLMVDFPADSVMAIALMFKVKPGMLVGSLEADLNVRVKNKKGKVVFDYTATGSAKKKFYTTYKKGDIASIDAREIQPLVEEAYNNARADFDEWLAKQKKKIK